MQNLYHKAVYRSQPFWPSDPDAKCQLAKFEHAQKAKCFGLKSDTTVFTFSLHLFSSPLHKFTSLFLHHFFFSFAGNLLSFTLLGIVFGKAFRILELDERKGRWVKQDFHGNFWVNVTWFFLPFSPVSLTESRSFWYGLKDLFTLHKLADKVVLGH